MSVKGASDLTLDDPLTESGDVTRPPGEGGDGDGVGGPREGGPEQPVVEPVLMSTEAQTEGPAMVVTTTTMGTLASNGCR
jgi:hypothetical protein